MEQRVAERAAMEERRAAREQRTAKFKSLRGLTALQLRAVIQAMGGQLPTQEGCRIEALRECAMGCEGWVDGHSLPDVAIRASQAVSVKTAAIKGMSTTEIRSALRRLGVLSTGTVTEIKLRIYPYLRDDGTIACTPTASPPSSNSPQDQGVIDAAHVEEGVEEGQEQPTYGENRAEEVASTEQEMVAADQEVEGAVEAREGAPGVVGVVPTMPRTARRRRPRRLFDYALLDVNNDSKRNNSKQKEAPHEDPGGEKAKGPLDDRRGKRQRTVTDYRLFGLRGVE
jgi:hypothetical protein